MLVELSVMEQRYQAVLAVVQDGWKVTEVAQRPGVSRQSVHTWIARYESGGLAALADHSHRPASCPHQTPAEIEAHICELRRQHPGWGPRRIEHQLGRLGLIPRPVAIGNLPLLAPSPWSSSAAGASAARSSAGGSANARCSCGRWT
jgi:transposase-like protein